MITEQEILTDITNIYRKIDQCYKSKAELEINISKERATIIELGNFMAEDVRRGSAGLRTRYDASAMQANVERCDQNIKLFQATIEVESVSIVRFLEIVSILQEDMKRPKEIIYDAATGQVVSKTGE